jgi:hypothetical protein
VADITSGIQGTFNQAHLAGRAAEAENARRRKAEQDRVRDARRRYVTTQEEVAQAQTLRDSRVDADKDGSDGQDARDCYESHQDLAGSDLPQASPAAPPHAPPPPDAASGNLIDIEA